MLTRSSTAPVHDVVVMKDGHFAGGFQLKDTVSDSGIGMEETAGKLANKALGRMPSVSALGQAARSGGVTGAAIGAGVEAVSSMIDVCKGRKEFGDAVIDVGAAAAKGGITGSGSAAAGTFASGATGAAVSALTTTGIGTAVASTAVGATALAAAPLVVGFGAACLVGSLISSIFD